MGRKYIPEVKKLHGRPAALASGGALFRDMVCLTTDWVSVYPNEDKNGDAETS